MSCRLLRNTIIQVLKESELNIWWGILSWNDKADMIIDRYEKELDDVDKPVNTILKKKDLTEEEESSERTKLLFRELYKTEG